jgi:hypothetical protein
MNHLAPLNAAHSHELYGDRLDAHVAAPEPSSTTRAGEPYRYRKLPIARRLLRKLGLELTPERERDVVLAFETIRKRK